MPRAYKHNNFFGSRDSEHLGRNRSKPATNDYSGGGAIDLTHAVLDGKIKNGMGILRPPGHHAMVDDSCGYCYLNNVALAARSALDRGVRRLVIVDWDVHHGQGTQRQFYQDDRVLYISIHRYEFGFWWPNLPESDFNAIGEGAGKGFNINLPLNVTGNNNSDYLAMWHSVILPTILEFNPELTLISAGYDPAVGCPEGEQNVTPACFAHFTKSLMEITNGKVAALLEGGYFVPSLAEGAALTLRTLLGDPVPMLLEGTSKPNEYIVDTIRNAQATLAEYWKCFDEFKVQTPSPLVWKGPPEPETAPFDIMCPTPPRSKEEENAFLELVKQLIRETKLVTFDNEQLNDEDILTEKSLVLFTEKKVQTLRGKLNQLEFTKEALRNERLSTLYIGKNKMTAQTGIFNLQNWTEGIFAAPMPDSELNFDCTCVLSDVGSIFRVVIPLLYRYNPTAVQLIITQKLQEEERWKVDCLTGQLKCLANGRIIICYDD